MINISKITTNPIPTFEAIKKAATAPLKYCGQNFVSLTGDTYGKALVQKRIFGLFDFGKLPTFPQNKMETFEQIAPDKLLLVHLTDYFPTDGKIKSSLESTNSIRNTTHFALNHSVVNPLGAGGPKGWTEKKYVIFAPFKKTCSVNSPIGGKYNDFMFEGSVNLPDGSFIYRQNPEIPQGKIKFSDAFQLTGKHGITLIEGSETPYDMGDDLIEKFGYTNLKDLHAAMLGQNRDMVNFANDAENLLNLGNKLASGELSEDEWLKLFGDIDFEKLGESVEKNIEKEQNWSDTWNKFIKSLKLSDVMHSETPYIDLERIVELIDALHLVGEKWQTRGVDCKTIIIEKIDKIIQNSEFKIKFIDLENLKQIIQNSATPTEAINKLRSIGIKGFEGYSKASSARLSTEIENLIQKITYIDKTPDFQFYLNF